MSAPPDPAGPRVSDLPAFDRVQDRGPGSAPSRRPWPRWAWVGLVALVAAGAALGTWALWPSDTAPGEFLVRLTQTADAFRPDLVTTRPDEAHDLVLDQLGWSVPPPDLPSLALVGVGVTSVASLRPTPAASPVEVQVPAFRFEGADGERAVVFVYDYILLDRMRGAYDLPDAVYAVLSEPTPVDSRVVDGVYVVTWRERAMLFSALTDDESTAEQIRQAVGA